MDIDKICRRLNPKLIRPIVYRIFSSACMGAGFGLVAQSMQATTYTQVIAAVVGFVVGTMVL